LSSHDVDSMAEIMWEWHDRAVPFKASSSSHDRSRPTYKGPASGANYCFRRDGRNWHCCATVTDRWRFRSMNGSAGKVALLDQSQ